MANYVDELRLGIKVEDNKSGEKVRSLANAISRLNRVIAQLDPALLKSTFGVLRREMGGLAKEAKSAEKALVAAAKVLRGGGIAKAVKEAQAASAQVQPVTQTTVSDTSNIATLQQQKEATLQIAQIEANISNILDEHATKKDQLIKRLNEIREKINDINISEEKRNELAKEAYDIARKINKEQKSALSQDFWRVNKYRIIREIIKQIEQGIADIAKQAASISPEMNNALSQATTSIDLLKASLGTVVISLLPAVAPLLYVISQTIATIANVVSRTIAALSNQSSYIRINTNYWKDYEKAVSKANGSLLAFDTFTTLKTKTSSDNMPDILERVDFSGNKVYDETIESLDKTKSSLSEILEIILAIGIAKLIQWIIGGKLVKSLKNIASCFTDIDNLIQAASFIALAASIKLLIDFIKQLVANWNNVDFEPWEKGVTIVLSLLAGIIGMVAAIKSLQMPVAAALAIGAALAAGVGTLFMSVSTDLKPTAYANGGMFNGAGTMYAIAGESGAEVVAQGSAGTGVLNVSQFRQAMVEALYEYGAARGQLDSISVNMDGNSVGRVVAGSNGFRSEAHRRGNGWR